MGPFVRLRKVARQAKNGLHGLVDTDEDHRNGKKCGRVGVDGATQGQMANGSTPSCHWIGR
jgi:hypothetical protein